jgi:hypothetical protein
MAIDDQNTNEATAPTPQRKRSAPRKRANKRTGSPARRTSQRANPVSDRSLTSNYRRKATDLARRGKRLVDDAYGWADEARSAVPRLTKGIHLPSPRTIESFAEANPVLLGAVGLGIGVVIGALLPRDAMHSGMQGLGLAHSSASGAAKRNRKSQAKK